MKPVVYVNADLTKAYEDNSFLTRLRDKFKIKLEEENFIKDLNLNISRVKLPPNFHKKAYLKNMNMARRFMKSGDTCLAPKTYRLLDYNILSDFQKKLFSYSVVNSIKLLLRVKNKSIKNSCVVLYDASSDMSINILFELAKECRYCILLSEDIKKISKVSEYVVANYGISPIVTTDKSFALNNSDFIVASKELDGVKSVPIWYLNNMYKPKTNISLAINDITYSVPWELGEFEMSTELLGAILDQMQEKDVETALKYNGVFLDKIKFNNDIRV